MVLRIVDQYPLFLDLKDRPCLIVGGGDVAARKADLLLRAGARLRIVAPHISEALRGLAETNPVDLTETPFDPRDLDGAVLAIAATDDRHVNASVSRHARLRNIPVNAVDDPDLCTFFTPAIVERGPVTIAISTGGRAPVLARWIRSRIETAVPHGIGALAAIAETARDAVARRLPDLAARRRFWERWFDGPAADLVARGRIEDAETDLADRLGWSAASGIGIGTVSLVGAGPGDPDLLTLKALRLLQSADVIVHDALASDNVIDLARRDAERIDVGKRRGRHSFSQSAINALLITEAEKGKRVVRLKGGDPFIFGRGGEELDAVLAAGIPCQVVPGITAAVGCAAANGLPLTHRDAAQSVTFVTGAGKDGLPDLDWAALARPGQTLAIYMGRSNLPEISARLHDAGMPPTTPAALIENGTLPDERVLTGTLATLPDIAAADPGNGPALIVVGDVVRFATARTEADHPAYATAAE